MAKEEKKQRIIIFNLSGTLVLPFDKKITLWCDSIRACSLSLAEKIIYENYQKSFRKEIIPLLAKAGNWTDRQVEEVISMVRTSFDNDSFSSLAGLAEGIKALKEHYDLGVATNRSRAELKKSFLDLGLKDNFFQIIQTSDNGVYKPDPRVFDVVLKDYQKEDVLYIGAAKNDLITAREAGIKFWAITSSICPQGLFWACGLAEEQTFASVNQAIIKLLEE